MACSENGIKGYTAAQADNMQRRAELERHERAFDIASKVERVGFALEGAESMLGVLLQGMVDGGERDTEEYMALEGLRSLLGYVHGDVLAVQDDAYGFARRL